MLYFKTPSDYAKNKAPQGRIPLEGCSLRPIREDLVGCTIKFGFVIFHDERRCFNISCDDQASLHTWREKLSSVGCVLQLEDSALPSSDAGTTVVRKTPTCSEILESSIHDELSVLEEQLAQLLDPEQADGATDGAAVDVLQRLVDRLRAELGRLQQPDG